MPPLFTTLLKVECYSSSMVGLHCSNCKFALTIPMHQNNKSKPGSQSKSHQIFVKLIFYCVNTSYPMDNSLSGRRRPARQTSEKDVLCLHQQVGPEYQCTRQMACRTSFLSRQSDVIASFSFGANQCTVENLYLPEFVFYQCLL